MSAAAWDSAAQGARLPSPHLREILHSGVQAPSAENRHFLRFEVLPDRVRLLSTDTASWSVQPHRRMLALLSYGAVVENMALRAAQWGESQSTHWLPDPAYPELIAECRWVRASTTADPLASAIADRHTNRRLYRRVPLAPAVLQRMTAAASTVSGAQVLWLDEPPARAAAKRTLWIAEAERFRRAALHQEIYSAIDFQAGWRSSRAEGLPPGALEVERPMRPFFSALRHWPLMHALSWLGAHRLLALRASYVPATMSAHLGLLSCTLDDPLLAALNAGRALERIWLAATHEGVAFQPMAAATALARQHPAAGWVSARTRLRIVEQLQRLTGGRPQAAFMFFRIGHAEAPSVVAGRRAVDDFVAA